MYRRIPFLLLLFVWFNAAANDPYVEINRLRAGGGLCTVADKLFPLKPHPALERAARNLAQGDKLQESLAAAGYRATRSSVLSVRGDRISARAAEVLAKQGYCPQLQNAAMTEIGLYVDARQVWIVMAAPFAPLVAMSEQAAGQRVLDLVNQARAMPRYCGGALFNAVRPLRWNDTLAAASRLHTEDMACHNYFSHRGRDASSPAQRIERAGYPYRATAENIAAGPAKPEDAVAGWIKSPGHCVNLMNPAYTEMGSAFAVDARSTMGVSWTQEFGAPR